MLVEWQYGIFVRADMGTRPRATLSLMFVHFNWSSTKSVEILITLTAGYAQLYRSCVAHSTDISHSRSPPYLFSNTCGLCHIGSSRLLHAYTSYHLTSMALARDDLW